MLQLVAVFPAETAVHLDQRSATSLGPRAKVVPDAQSAHILPPAQLHCASLGDALTGAWRIAQANRAQLNSLDEMLQRDAKVQGNVAALGSVRRPVLAPADE